MLWELDTIVLIFQIKMIQAYLSSKRFRVLPASFGEAESQHRNNLGQLGTTFLTFSPFESTFRGSAKPIPGAAPRFTKPSHSLRPQPEVPISGPSHGGNPSRLQLRAMEK